MARAARDSQALKLSGLTEALANPESVNELLRVMVHTILAEQGAKAAILVQVRNETTLEVVDSYGYEDSAVVSGVAWDLWGQTALASAIRSGVILSYKDRAAYLKDYPGNAHWNLPGDGFVAVPIWRRGYPFAGLGVSLDVNDMAEGVTLDSAIWPTLRSVLEISLAAPIWVAELDPNAHSAMVESPRAGSMTLLAEELTDRQLEVLAAMAEGMTNRQIAGALHVSESTIGKETVAIYSFLDVHTRAEAVTHAIALKLIAPPQNASHV
jgi:DNA-binding CsgD family transcriptional regulator